MSMMLQRPNTSDELLPISAALNEFVNRFDLAPKRNIVVYCFGSGEPGWEKLPTAWHRPTHGDIVLNMAAVLQSFHKRGLLTTSIHRTLTGGFHIDEALIQSTAHSIRSWIPDDPTGGNRYRTHTEDGMAFSRAKLARTHPAIRNALRPKADSASTGGMKMQDALLALLLHETGHTVFSQFITEDWFTALTPYERQIITVLEELRCERRQLDRIGSGDGTALLRKAVDIVVDPDKVAQDIREVGDEGQVNIPNLALNSTLCLGRTLYDVFLEREVADLRRLVAAAVGPTRHTAMVGIWEEYSSIRETDPELMTDIAQRWAELFPSEKDGSGVSSSTAPDPSAESGDDGDTGQSPADSEGEESGESLGLPGMLGDLEERLAEAAEKAAEHPEDTNHEYGPTDRKPAAESLREATLSTRAHRLAVKTFPPLPEDLRAARKLAQELGQLNVPERTSTRSNSAVPPGRLRGRAMVQRAAELAQGRPPTAEPWRRVRREVHLNPPLTVGVLTDTSGSQKWATEFSSRVAWILARSVTEINGQVAYATFGEVVHVLQKPREVVQGRREVQAVDDTEMFDTGVGALDALLHLSTPGSTRILFVVTDGQFVAEGGVEMVRAAEWVQELTRTGCLVVWITPDPHGECWGMPTAPEGASILAVRPSEVRENPPLAIEQIVRIVKQEMARRNRR